MLVYQKSLKNTAILKDAEKDEEVVKVATNIKIQIKL